MKTNNAILNSFIGPMMELLNQDGVTELSVNRPGVVWLERHGVLARHEMPEINFSQLTNVAQMIAGQNQQQINAEKPLLSTTLRTGERVQIIMPPCVDDGHVVMGIRKPSPLRLTLDDYEKQGAFDQAKLAEEATDHPAKTELRTLLQARQIREAIDLIIAERLNTIVSGGTSTGKTTFMNAMINAIPSQRWIVTIEDSRELRLGHDNVAYLLASKGEQSTAKVTVQDLLEASLRLRPDRILLGELRGAEAFTYLQATNTGHPGSIASLHADSTSAAIYQLTLKVMQANMGLSWDDIQRYVSSVTDVIVQMHRDSDRRYVSEILVL